MDIKATDFMRSMGVEVIEVDLNSRVLSNTEKIENSAVYKQIMKDSYGGVIYDVANRNKYETEELLQWWNSMGRSEQSMAGGIMAGAFNFLRGDEY